MGVPALRPEQMGVQALRPEPREMRSLPAPQEDLPQKAVYTARSVRLAVDAQGASMVLNAVFKRPIWPSNVP